MKSDIHRRMNEFVFPIIERHDTTFTTSIFGLFFVCRYFYPTLKKLVPHHRSCASTQIFSTLSIINKENNSHVFIKSS